MHKTYKMLMIGILLLVPIIAIAVGAGNDRPKQPERVASSQPSNNKPKPVDFRWFNRLDKNRDGAPTQEEFVAKQVRAFKRVDTDGNGIMTKQEVIEDRERLRQKKEADKAARAARAAGQKPVSTQPTPAPEKP